MNQILTASVGSLQSSSLALASSRHIPLLETYHLFSVNHCLKKYTRWAKTLCVLQSVWCHQECRGHFALKECMTVKANSQPLNFLQGSWQERTSTLMVHLTLDCSMMSL